MEVDDPVLQIYLLIIQVVLLAQLNHSILEDHEEVFLVQNSQTFLVVLTPDPIADLVKLFFSEINFNVVLHYFLLSYKVVVFILFEVNILAVHCLPAFEVSLRLVVQLKLFYINHLLLLQDGNRELDKTFWNLTLFELHLNWMLVHPYVSRHVKLGLTENNIRIAGSITILCSLCLHFNLE